jgi:hypothetical protein
MTSTFGKSGFSTCCYFDFKKKQRARISRLDRNCLHRMQAHWTAFMRMRKRCSSLCKTGSLANKYLCNLNNMRLSVVDDCAKQHYATVDLGGVIKHSRFLHNLSFSNSVFHSFTMSTFAMRIWRCTEYLHLHLLFHHPCNILQSIKSTPRASCTYSEQSAIS